jgi:hypothetical protein
MPVLKRVRVIKKVQEGDAWRFVLAPAGRQALCLGPAPRGVLPGVVGLRPEASRGGRRYTQSGDRRAAS